MLRAVLSCVCAFDVDPHAGSLFFYMFQQQTVASSFIADMMYGSGKYVATGRGFNITSLDFVKVGAGRTPCTRGRAHGAQGAPAALQRQAKRAHP